MIRLEQLACEPETHNLLAFDDFALRLIRRKARRLAQCAGFTSADREDLEQELLVKVWEAADKFDPQLSHPHAFIATVVERAAATLARGQKALKRGNHVSHCALGTPAFCQSERELVAETVEMGLTSTFSHEADLDLTSDLAEVMSHLPEELREVAERLGGASKRAVARTLGISRRVLQQRIDGLREHFVAAGLDEVS